MITRRARNEEINRRKSRRKHAIRIQEHVDKIVGEVSSRCLLDAVDRGAIEEVERLCTEDEERKDEVNVNYIGSRELTPLHMSGFASTSKVLIENGADVNLKSIEKSSGEIYGGGVFSMGGHTALHYCKLSFIFPYCLFLYDRALMVCYFTYSILISCLFFFWKLHTAVSWTMYEFYCKIRYMFE